MSQEQSVGPNPRVAEVYERLRELLDRGDDAFIEDGPRVVQDAIGDPGFFEGVDTDHADPGEYTRRKVAGRPDGPVIRFMEWPPEYALVPHEHHGRPCFEVLVEGTLFLTDFEPERVEGSGSAGDGAGADRYLLHETGHEVCEPGDAGVVDPRNGSDVHSVYSPVRSRSLHVYPDDNYHAYGYVHVGDGDPDRDLYERERFELRNGE